MGFLDKAGLERLWGKVEAALSGKQDKLTGTAGQVVGFNAEGEAVAQDAPECVSMEQVEAAIQSALGVIEAELAEL